MRDLDKSEKAKFDPDVDKQARLWSEKLELEFGVTKEHVQKVFPKFQTVLKSLLEFILENAGMLK